MKLLDKRVTCTHCHTTHAWWQVATCSFCGQTICRNHAALLRRNHSTVLSVVCQDCAQRVAASSSPVQRVAQHAMSV